MNALGPLQVRERIADAVLDRLRNAILSGDLAPGAKLSVPALAAELQVSRSPVREAVQRLTAERLAREEPRHGCTVITLRPEELIPVYDVREVLEGLAARQVAESHSTEFRSELERILKEDQRAVTAGDIDAHVRLDMAFHKIIRDETGNLMLCDVLNSISGIMQLAARTTSALRTTKGNVALAEHLLIAEAILDQDGDLAETIARSHIARLRALVVADATATALAADEVLA